MAQKEKVEYQTEFQWNDPKPLKAIDNIDLPGNFTALPNIREESVSISKDASMEEKNSSFGFEKTKVQNLQIGPTYQTDVNDENIQKLKEDVLKKCQQTMLIYDKYSNFLRGTAIIVLSLNILEIIAYFFLLLFLSAQHIPSNQILMWVGLAMVLCIGSIYIVIKGINSSQSKNNNDIKEFLWCSLLFLIFYVMVSVFFILVLSGLVVTSSAVLSENQLDKLFLVEILITATTFLKIFGQGIFIFFGRILKEKLDIMSGDERRGIASESNLAP